ncbi:hypothetical protein HRR83_000588 [Exophiala dermatitidis]|uniref:Uncharacterized protein n=1 Tax=Exophiala dermatitidis TaxID=5970 RepID=A0AAN6F1Q0_EXODE|nr:hypothetical protein HRR74_000590 [Exophiala dermatitidis]KAJ4528470.1 hypothetical protein HRR73_001093 [Exophiala dermatitidis]KAJ4531433.1 hypothetical protein HRR76_009088 [Exophiala dermatitidis]KAJ4558595.1 hypothetical protein HRR77_000588 [Exophiala dermatitidis]KAJ4581371.1 hypothetical protein HRR79_000408 [Exophiala dermatitidis]
MNGRVSFATTTLTNGMSAETVSSTPRGKIGHGSLGGRIVCALSLTDVLSAPGASCGDWLRDDSHLPCLGSQRCRYVRCGNESRSQGRGSSKLGILFVLSEE